MVLSFLLPFLAPFAPQTPFQITGSVRDGYTKQEVMIPMRDGKKLYTAIYAPKSTAEKWPFLMERTPYGAGPYGPKAIANRLGPSIEFQRRGYIFVYQDVRGRWMSEGNHLYSPPPFATHPGTTFDETTDAYDTVEWLLKNVPNNNGRVGIWGISQPGFYASNALLSGHPAIVAVSPQAPVTDRFKGDDDHHNGAYFLAQRFSLLASFGAPRPVPTDKPAPGYRMPIADAYRFFLDEGPLDNLQKIFHHLNRFWNFETEHPNYDEFWQSRGMEHALKGIKGPAVLTVGGFYDAEDMWGALHTYQAIEKQNPGLTNTIVMGPWSHGQWAGDDGERLGPIEFGSKTGKKFRDEVQFPWFEHYLRDGADPKLPEAMMFESGTNKWLNFPVWPPRNVENQLVLLEPDGALSIVPSPIAKVSRPDVFESYTSDPRRPVPYTNEMTPGVPRTFMVENQRFAWSRPDVLTFTSPVLKNDITLAGPIQANLWLKSTATDSDYVVKVIDDYPDDAPSNDAVTPVVRMAGYQMLVRWEVMRGKFRNSLVTPEPLKPGQLTQVNFELNDLLHTFKKGHRLMVQIQSSMFPLVDNNPQQFETIYDAKAKDFHSAVQSIAVGGPHQSTLSVGVLPK